MPGKFKISAVAVLIVSILFYLFFDTSKHYPAFSSVNPFAEDPYDAVGSFGIQAALLLALLSCMRAFGPSRASSVSENRKAFLARTQMMAILAIGITLAGDTIAMLRHPSLWTGPDSGHRLAVLLVGIGVLSAVVGCLLYRFTRGITLPVVPNTWNRAAIISIACALILALYPETLRHGLFGALFTVIVGMALLFIPMRELGIALVPYRTEAGQHDARWLRWFYSRRYLWSLVVIAGILTGLFFALAELRENSGWPHLSRHVLFVALIYASLETVGVLMGCVLLRKPLGLFSPNSRYL
ncbi:MAG TPA: hypothetical protein VMU62_02860 [Acidobacteriaceae bacterium]|nr:hypothetical protein [Acidobacteriaceae bacterium]